MKAKLRLCSHPVVVSGDYEAYSKYSNLVTDVIRDRVPLFEKSSIDEFYVDMTGMERFFGCSLYSVDLNFLRAELSRMTEKIAYQLRSENKFTGCFTVKIRYSDFETHTTQKAVAYTKSDYA